MALLVLHRARLAVPGRNARALSGLRWQLILAGHWTSCWPVLSILPGEAGLTGRESPACCFLVPDAGSETQEAHQ